MTDCRRILVPVDLAEFPARLAPCVRTVAQKFGAEVHLVYVERPLREHTAGMVPDISVTRKFAAEALAEAEAQISELAAQHFQGCAVVRTRVLEGRIAEQLASYVQAEKIDLIIIGTHGRKAVGHLVFGSVAEEVLKTSQIPVLALKPFRAPATHPFGLSVEEDKDLQEELSQYKTD